MNCAEKILYHALKGVRQSAGVLATVSLVMFGSRKVLRSAVECSLRNVHLNLD
jgi:hypothetical protein